MGWTEALAAYLGRHTHEPLQMLRLRTGLPVNRIRSLQEDILQKSTEHSLPDTIETMGIDEIYVNRSRLTVVTDITRQRLLRLEAVAGTVDGLADRIDLKNLLSELPAPKRIALDMNPAVIAIIRAVWPNTVIVIDKRHALQTADRSLQQVIRHLLENRHKRQSGLPHTPNLYGEAGFQLNYLKRFVMRRPTAMGPADLALWTILRTEEPLLWQAYVQRERLYRLFTGPGSHEELKEGLQRWRDVTSRWLEKVTAEHPNARLPMTAPLWMIGVHLDRLAQYGDENVTNAFTESVNARIRERVRRGRRYDVQHVKRLVNQDLARKRRDDDHAPKVPGELRPSPPHLSDVVMVTESSLPTELTPPFPAGGSHHQSVRTRRNKVRVWDLPERVERWLASGGTRDRERRRKAVLDQADSRNRASWLAALTGVQQVSDDLRFAILTAYHSVHPLPNGLTAEVQAMLSGRQPVPAGALPPFIRLAEFAAEPGVMPDSIQATVATVVKLRALLSNTPLDSPSEDLLKTFRNALEEWRRASTRQDDYNCTAQFLQPDLTIGGSTLRRLLAVEVLGFPLMAEASGRAVPVYREDELSRLRPLWARQAADALKMSN